MNEEKITKIKREVVNTLLFGFFKRCFYDKNVAGLEKLSMGLHRR